MLRPVLIVAAVAALAVAGVVEGVRSNRWGESADAREAAGRLDRVPAAFGPWTSTEFPMSDRVLRVAEAVGHVSRTYRNGTTGQEVSVLLLCGPPGPIGSHTPDVCYAGNGYKMQRAEVRHPLALSGGAAASYWSARFGKDGEAPLEVCWAWGVDGDWEAADSARTAYALQPALYKLYATRVVRPDPPGGPASTADPIAEFLTAFLPEVKKALSPAAPSAAPK
jgi:hypothetical protein